LSGSGRIPCFRKWGRFPPPPWMKTAGGFCQKASMHFVSANLFHLLGTQPRFGRLFREDEEREDRNHVAILSDSYCERRFHRDPKALGKTVTLDGTAYTVIGVLPSVFYMPRTRFDDSQPDVVVPLPPLTPNPGGILQVSVWRDSAPACRWVISDQNVVKDGCGILQTGKPLHLPVFRRGVAFTVTNGRVVADSVIGRKRRSGRSQMSPTSSG
jgi:hypothetical protein